MNDKQNGYFDSLMQKFKILFICWLIGFFANPIIFHKEFDLASVWQGWGVLASAGTLAILRFAIDSYANSPKGEHPYIDKVVNMVTGKEEENGKAGNERP